MNSFCFFFFFFFSEDISERWLSQQLPDFRSIADYTREPRVSETMEKLSDYFLLGWFKVLLVNFLSKTRKTFDGQRIRKFCYCIHSMKSTRTRFGHCYSCIIHEFPLQMGHSLCAMYCVLYELWICRTDLCDQIIQRYDNTL